MASIEISEFPETTVTSIGDNGANASSSGTSKLCFSGNHLGVYEGNRYVRKPLPIKENGEPNHSAKPTSSQAERFRQYTEDNSVGKLTCPYCFLRKRFHLFSVFRYVFIGVVFVTWLSVTVSICVMAFTYAFYLGLIALLIVFLQLLPVLVIFIATYCNCCGICDGRQRNGYRSHVVSCPRQQIQEQTTPNFTVVMPTVVVSQATDSPSMAVNATSC